LAQAVRAAGVAECWIVGRAAEGLLLQPSEAIGFAVSFAGGVPSDLADKRSLLESALATFGYPFALSVRLERPEEGLEVIFPSNP